MAGIFTIYKNDSRPLPHEPCPAGLVASAGGAPFTIAGVMGHIVVIETTVTVIAEVGSAEESTKGIAAMVVIVFLDETNDLARRSGGSSKK